MSSSSPVQRRSIGSAEIHFIDLNQVQMHDASVVFLSSDEESECSLDAPTTAYLSEDESQANVILSQTRRNPGLQLQAETSETCHMRMPQFSAQVYLGRSISTQSSSTTASEATGQKRQIARQIERQIAHPETKSVLSLPGTLESVQPQASIGASIIRSANSIAVSTAASVSGAQSSDLSSSIMAKKFKCAKFHREYIHKARLLRHYKASPSCNGLNPASQIQTRDPGYFDTKQCRLCGAADFFFGTVQETRRHYREQHPITCIECALRCYDERDREVHEREHHGLSYSLEDEEQELPAVESRLAATEAPVRPLSQSLCLNLPSAMDALIKTTSVTSESDQHSSSETIPIEPRISVKKAYFSENKLPSFFKPPTKLEMNSSSLIAEICGVSESTDGLIKGYGSISTMKTKQKSTLFRASAEEKQVLNLPTVVALDELDYEQVEEITAVEKQPKFVNVAVARTLRPNRMRDKLINFESQTVEDTVETPDVEMAEEMPNPYPHSANCIVEVVERSELARASLSAPVEVKRNAKKRKLNVAERTVESQKAVASKSEKASDASSVELVKMRARKTVRSSKRRKEGESYCSAVSDASGESAAKRKKVKTSSDTTAASEALPEKLSTEKTLAGSEINPVSTGAQNQNIKVDKSYNGAAKLHNLSNSEKQISSSALLPKPSASSTKATKSPEQLKTVPDSTAVCLPVQRPAFFVAKTASSSGKLSAAILSKPSLEVPKKSPVAVPGKPSHAMLEKPATVFPEKTIAEIPQKPSTAISKKLNAAIPEKVTATNWSEKMKTLVSSPKVIPLVSKEVASNSKTPLAISTADMDAGKDAPLMATDVQESLSSVPLSNSFSFEPRKHVQHTRKELTDSQLLGQSNSFSNKSPVVVPYLFLSNLATKRPAHVALNDSAMSRSPPKVAKPALPTSNKRTDRESRTKAYERSPEKTTSTVIIPSMKQTECYSLPQRIDGRNRKQSEAINSPRSSNISGYGSHRNHTDKRSNESNSRCVFMSSEKLSKEVKSSGVPTSSENQNRDSKSGTTVCIRTKPNSSFSCTSELPTKQQSKTTVIPLVRTQLAELSGCSSNAVSSEVCEALSSSACSSSVSRVTSVPLTIQKALSSPAVPSTTHRFSSLSTHTDEDEPPPLKPFRPFETHNNYNDNISAKSGIVSTALSSDDLGDDIFTDDVGCANQTSQSRKFERKGDINFRIYVEISNRSTAISGNAIQDLATANTGSFPTAISNSPSWKQYNWKSSGTSSDASSKVSPSSNKALKESGKHIASKKFCELCKKSSCELEKHFDKFHWPKPSIEPVPGCQKCEDCGLYFGKSLYSKHRIRYHDRLGSKHICYRCGLEFQCNGYLIDHLKFEHREQSKQNVDLSSTEDKYRYRLARSGAESIE
ncbi:uncharacterized protein LOC134847935 isoform X2 [Symsagittifera roscoffensis]|uniref:uncharacterized protein LOC134847935 isoform X2 n=1 Tax=Symsagittifera roscoffensis TaxID=84072 RepID=UPI00307C2363